MIEQITSRNMRTQLRRLRMTAVVVALALLSMGCHGRPAEPLPKPVDAVSGIVSAFKSHPVVIVGEWHWIRQAGDFYIGLVRDPAFQDVAQNIVVEFASRNNQELLDRYIAGEDVPISDVRRIWRDTTKVASWESPIYAEWLAAIRDVNRTRPPGRRLRVLAGDTAIDWSHIHTHEQWATLGDNNVSFADVISTEVLAKHQHAFVVLGANHVGRSGDRKGDPNTTTRVEAHYPGATYVVILDAGGWLTKSTEELIEQAAQHPPELFNLTGTTLGQTADRNGVPLSKRADALLYLCPPEDLKTAYPPPGSLDPQYLKEIDRRSMIEWGELRARKFLGAAAR